MHNTFFGEDHEDYRATVREFIRREVTPVYSDWEDDRLVPRSVWLRGGETGLFGLAVPEELGGAGVKDYRFRMVVAEEVAAAGATSFGAGLGLQDDIIIPYIMDLANDEQSRRWLPGLATGELIGAIAMTEPGTGSDLQAIRTTASRRDGGWVVNGQKTFITSGIHADLVIVVARTDPDAGSRGFSLLVVERDSEGFERGRKLDKIGLAAQDTAELFFTDVFVPDANVLGTVGEGFRYLMERLPRERLSIAASGITAAEAAVKLTQEYVFERRAFGKRVGDFQNTRFVLAELETEVEVARAYVDKAILALNDGHLTAVDASKAKWFVSELQVRVTTRCLQLFGGYGFMNEYPIARAFKDSRIQTIYGGTTEIMKEVIGRDIASRFGQ